MQDRQAIYSFLCQSGLSCKYCVCLQIPYLESLKGERKKGGAGCKQLKTREKCESIRQSELLGRVIRRGILSLDVFLLISLRYMRVERSFGHCLELNTKNQSLEI